MFCPKCGKEIEGSPKFCPSCGAAISGVTKFSSETESTLSGSVTINNLFDNKNILRKESGGCFTVYEHQNDLSVSPQTSSILYFMQQMNVRKRQVLCKLEGKPIKLQAGAMQWMSGNIHMNSDVDSVGSFLGKRNNNR